VGSISIPVFCPHPPVADWVTVSIGEPRLTGEFSTEIGNGRKDFAGAQLGKSDDACGLDRLRGADIGQETQAGPYFRSRSAEPGDGLPGGTSAGFWIKLHSTGSVTMRRLNPIATIAFTKPDPGFDSSAFTHSMSSPVAERCKPPWMANR